MKKVDCYGGEWETARLEDVAWVEILGCCSPPRLDLGQIEMVDSSGGEWETARL